MRHAALLLLAGCDDTLLGVQADGNTTGTTPTATGYAGVQELALDRCLPCHSTDGNELGLGLDLETDLHAATVNVTGQYGLPLVVPNDAESSMLYLKIAGTNPSGTGGPMPPTGVVAAGSLALVEEWIVAGAPAE